VLFLALPFLNQSIEAVRSIAVMDIELRSSVYTTAELAPRSQFSAVTVTGKRLRCCEYRRFGDSPGDPERGSGTVFSSDTPFKVENRVHRGASGDPKDHSEMI